ncbi:glycosyltransferase family 4 protein [Mucilaginibacter sp. dw_454]|uniref:glycosyltransferase family 4 protein n=1 Tax=Mucilaginibacter sp. dw_454 TaxID=2720079 RepID=UPI001BD5182D|nr:glycosyltransferase family 4 protein [Mucilaginibacter sp. dw_454]
MKIIITSPSLDINTNVSGISAVTNFIIKLNTQHTYIHFEIGKKDGESRGLAWLLGLLVMYWKWFFLMCTSRDFIHFNFPVDKRSIIRDGPMILLAKLFRKRMLLHLHGGEYLMHDDHPGWVKTMIPAILSGNNPKIVLSTVEEEYIIKKYNCKNVYTLPNCIDLTEAEKFERTEHPTDGLVLLFLGRVVTDKGLEYIFQALKALKNQGLPFTFVLAGKGPDEEEYKTKFNDLLGKSFDFRGVVGGKSKSNAFKDCDVFLLPSFFEGLPIALLEAMSFGLVPVTTDVGSIANVVKHDINGILVRTKSSEDIADAIIKLSSDRGFLHQLSTNARNTIFEEYSPARYFDLLNNIYQYE